jgi:putative redox protein
MGALSVNLESLDDKAMLAATARDNPRIVIDYFPPVGTGQGYTSMELLMAAYGSCVSTVLVSILRYRMKKTVHGVSISVEGTPRESHPKSREQMTTVLRLKAEGVTPEEARHALEDAEKVCPVGAMLKGNVVLDVSVELV